MGNIMTEELNYYTRHKKLNILFIVVFIVIFVLGQLSLALNSFSLYFLVPFLFLYSLIKNPKLIWKYKPLLYFLLLIIWSAVTCVKSVYMEDSLQELKTLLGGFALCYIITQFSIKNHRYIYVFYAIYVLMLFVVSIRAYNEGLTDSLSERFSTDKLNANFFGYVGFNAIVSSFFIWQFAKSSVIQIKNKSNIYLFLFIVTSILSLIANLYAASRAGIAISLITIILFVIVKFLIPFSGKSIINLILLSFLVLLVFFNSRGLFMGSNLQERIVTESLETDARPRLLEEAYNVGLKNPLLGVGPANFKHYSDNNGLGGFAHSTYFEIFANNGILALALFIAMLLSFFKKIWKYKPINANQRKRKLYFHIFITLFIVYNFFYVFHTSPFLISFYYLVLIHSYYSFQNNRIITFIENK